MEKGDFKISKGELDEQEIRVTVNGPKDSVTVEVWLEDDNSFAEITLNRQEWWQLIMWLLFNFRSE